MIKRILYFLTAFVITITGASAANYEPDEMINISVYEKINPAIVAIDAQTQDGISAGTGCVVSSDGLILTGSHVVEGCKSVEVTTFNGQVYKARIVSKMGKNKDIEPYTVNGFYSTFFKI